MEIRLDQIADQPLEWRERRRIDVAALEREDLVGLGEIEWHGRVERLATGFLFSARLSYEQTLTCSRCLTSWTSPVIGDLELLVLQDAPQPTTGEYELTESELGVLHVEGDLLDTLPILMEQLQLNIPMRSLCREECAGLCPECGADLNQGPCECAEPPADPRWSGLPSLEPGRKG